MEILLNKVSVKFLLLFSIEYFCAKIANIEGQNGVKYDGPNGSFFYFDTNSQFRIPNSEFRIPNSDFRILISEFRIPNSEFRIPHFEKKCGV